MKQIVVVYWSQTGNTEQMANAICEGIQRAGGEAVCKQVGDTSAQEIAKFDTIALGCPAMGAEVLEETEFEPFFAELENQLGGKHVALFGSYGWGDGQWMRDWIVRADMATLVPEDGLMIHETPDEEGLEACRTLGEQLAKI